MDWTKVAGLIGASIAFIFSLALSLRGIVTDGRDKIVEILQSESQPILPYVEHMLLVEVQQPGITLVTVILGYGVICGITFWLVPWPKIADMGAKLKYVMVFLCLSALLGGSYTAWSLSEKVSFLKQEISRATSQISDSGT